MTVGVLLNVNIFDKFLFIVVILQYDIYLFDVDLGGNVGLIWEASVQGPFLKGVGVLEGHGNRRRRFPFVGIFFIIT